MYKRLYILNKLFHNHNSWRRLGESNKQGFEHALCCAVYSVGNLCLTVLHLCLHVVFIRFNTLRKKSKRHQTKPNCTLKIVNMQYTHAIMLPTL